MDMAKNWLKSYTAVIAAVIAILTPILEVAVGLQPYLGEFGPHVVTGIGFLLLIARALKQESVSGGIPND